MNLPTPQTVTALCSTFTLQQAGASQSARARPLHSAAPSPARETPWGPGLLEVSKRFHFSIDCAMNRPSSDVPPLPPRFLGQRSCGWDVPTFGLNAAVRMCSRLHTCSLPLQSARWGVWVEVKLRADVGRGGWNCYETGGNWLRCPRRSSWELTGRCPETLDSPRSRRPASCALPGSVSLRVCPRLPLSRPDDQVVFLSVSVSLVILIHCSPSHRYSF